MSRKYGIFPYFQDAGPPQRSPFAPSYSANSSNRLRIAFWTIPSRRQSSAILSSPRKPSSTIRILAVRRKVVPRGATDVLDHLCRRLFRRLHRSVHSSRCVSDHPAAFSTNDADARCNHQSSQPKPAQGPRAQRGRPPPRHRLHLYADRGPHAMSLGQRRGIRRSPVCVNRDS
jgi:hypothetical protein